MRLELLHETLVIQLCLTPVVLLVIVPVLFRRRQYLQPFLSQNGYPLSESFVPICLLGPGVDVPRLSVLVLGLVVVFLSTGGKFK